MADDTQWITAPQGWMVTVSYSDGTRDTTYGVVAFSAGSDDPYDARAGDCLIVPLDGQGWCAEPLSGRLESFSDVERVTFSVKGR